MKNTSVQPVLVSGEGSNLLLVPGRALANSLLAALSSWMPLYSFPAACQLMQVRGNTSYQPWKM